MNRFPDEIIILKPQDGGTPYEAAPWQQVYTGRCRCFLDRQAAFRTNKVMDCTYQVVIPDRHMPEIGENFKVGVRMHTNKSNHNWDLVGYVKDFARFDRVCNLYFQMVKENLIYEDLPPKGYDLTERKIVTYDDDMLHIESEGMLMNGEQLVACKPILAWFKTQGKRVLITNNLPGEESSESEEPQEEVIYDKPRGSLYGETNITSLLYFAGAYLEEDSDYERVIIVPNKFCESYSEDNKATITFHVQEQTGPDEWEDIYTKDYVIVT